MLTFLLNRTLYVLNGSVIILQFMPCWSAVSLLWLQHTTAQQYNLALYYGMLLFRCDTDWFTFRETFLSWLMDSAQVPETSMSGRRGAKGGWDATPPGNSSSQPAVVPLFPWQRRWGAAELQSEVMIYKMGGGVWKEKQVVGGEKREYCRKRM